MKKITTPTIRRMVAISINFSLIGASFLKNGDPTIRKLLLTGDE
jgi:hypothetical protein